MKVGRKDLCVALAFANLATCACALVFAVLVGMCSGCNPEVSLRARVLDTGLDVEAPELFIMLPPRHVLCFTEAEPGGAIVEADAVSPDAEFARYVAADRGWWMCPRRDIDYGAAHCLRGWAPYERADCYKLFAGGGP